ncbi:chitosanase [Serratia marcescens]|uniref:Chitosanase n=1 Tax=Serratia marcescens TaxID=615 RepID=A0A5C7BZL7_SERMA|nr:chitosanase [Serratia marcescens]TXE26195.1 chitosanase [Serratia marcescens]TXE54390.1 chitosanase [Serratia marcescens]
MDNKSELSKPVATVDVQRGRMDGNTFAVAWSSAGHALPDGPHFIYAQEYVSALLADNEYMRWRIKEIDLLFGQMLLTMQAAVIEIEHGEGPNAAMAWIVNKLAGPGEFAPDSEKDAQAYFNRESEKIDVEYSKCMDFFESRRKAMKEQSNG